MAITIWKINCVIVILMFFITNCTLQHGFNYKTEKSTAPVPITNTSHKIEPIVVINVYLQCNFSPINNCSIFNAMLVFIQ